MKVNHNKKYLTHFWWKLKKTGTLPYINRLVGLVVKASASRAEGPWFESRLRGHFSQVESYQRLKNWQPSGYPARRLAF